MNQGSFCLNYFRRPTACRDVIIAIQAGLTLLMPCYGGIPDWWIARGVVRSEVTSDNKAALNAGQLKHAVTQAVNEMNLHHASAGGAGTELNALVAGWNVEGPEVDNFEMVNVGQVKAVLKLWYDRLNTIHSTTGYPWPQVATSNNFEGVNVGQLKKLLQIDVRRPWNQNLAQGYGVAAGAQLETPGGELKNQSAILSARDHYLRNPLLSLASREIANSAVSLPKNAANIPSVPAATSAGEFKVGQDGSANYTVRLQGPKGVGNVEPAISLDYNSNGGDGIVGLGWSLSGLSVINRGPSSIDVDGFYDPADFDDNDRFYMDGERLICVRGEYGKDDSEYRTLKEQFSRVTYHKAGTEDWFEVQTKAGLTMEFGHNSTSSIGPKENGVWAAHPKLTWAVSKLKDSQGNFWSVEYADMSPGQEVGENTPYLPDYQPAVIRYTGRDNGTTTVLEPMHEIRFLYEQKPDTQRNYMMGFSVRKDARLRGVQISTRGTAVRSWRLRYNLDAAYIPLRGERSRLESIQEVAGAVDDRQAPALPATLFTWEEGERTWEKAGSPATDQLQTIRYPNNQLPVGGVSALRLEYRSHDNTIRAPNFPTTPWTTDQSDRFFSKQPNYVDLDGDGINEIFINHRGVRESAQKYTDAGVDDDGASRVDGKYVFQNEHRQVYHKENIDASVWDIITPFTVERCSPFMIYQDYGMPAVPMITKWSQLTTNAFQLGVNDLHSNQPFNISVFPYLTTAAFVPTGAMLVDVNSDGLPDIISSGSFDELEATYQTFERNKITNAPGVWINQGGNFVKELDGIAETPTDHDYTGSTPLVDTDVWGGWRFPLVPSEVIASAGGAIGTRPSTTPIELCSGVDEILKTPEFAQFKENDLGWRVVDMDGDGDMDIIRAGQGKEASGWHTVTITPATTTQPSTTTYSLSGTPLATGPLSSKGRQLCFGLRNNGPLAPAGQRWTLMNDPEDALASNLPNPAKHLKSIWKLPLPLVSDNGKLDMGRRLIDMNGDGLPDFVVQKKRSAAFVGAAYTKGDFDMYDIKVYLNGGVNGGWIDGGDAWTLEGVFLANGIANGTVDYGRALMDMNGDNLPDFVVSFYAATTSPYGQKAVYLNTGKGWVKSATNAPVNFASLSPPEYLYVYTSTSGVTSTRSYSLMDMTGDGKPEFINGFDALATLMPGSSTDKVGLTQFIAPNQTWVKSNTDRANSDWNISDDLLSAGTLTPLNFTELNGDGVLDVLRVSRVAETSSEWVTVGTKTHFRKGLFKSPRISRVVNGLGVPIDITYGELPRLAGTGPDARYRRETVAMGATVLNGFAGNDGGVLKALAPGATPSSVKQTGIRDTIPSASVVTDYTTFDGTEDALGNQGATITTSYYYAGLRSHPTKGSLGFQSMETRSSLSPLRQVTYFSQEGDTIGMSLGGMTYELANGTEKVISRSTTAYDVMNIIASINDATKPSSERHGRSSYLIYAKRSIQENWAPEGPAMGKTTSESVYGSAADHELGMLKSQTVRQDQAMDQSPANDVISTTLHEYDENAPASASTTGSGAWRLGQIKKTTVTASAPGADPVTKVSAFAYYPSGHANAGMLMTETIDPGTASVSKLHVYDANGNEVKTLTSAAGMPTLVSETWYDSSGRFPVAASNALGHTTITTYDTTRSVATSATMVFQGPVPSTGTGHSATPPSPPSSTLSTSTLYDQWATAKVTTAADGLRSVRYAMYFVDPALPRCLYYVYEQAEGSAPVITYFDRYHRALLVEKTGFNGETILQEKQYDHKGRAVRESQPYLAGTEVPIYSVEEYDAYDRKVKATAPDGSFVTVNYNGFRSSMTNHHGKTKSRLADMNERVLESEDVDGNTVLFSYTADGQPKTATTVFAGGASASTVITTEYNAQRLKSKVTDPNTGSSFTYYDNYGRTRATKDALGVWSVVKYDLLGRTTHQWSGVPTFDPASSADPTSYETLTVTTFDFETATNFGLGKPHTVSFTHKDGAATRTVVETYAYDTLGRGTGTTVTLGGQVAFNGTYTTSTTYFASGSPGFGRTATITDAGGHQRASVYNALGFLCQVNEVRGLPDTAGTPASVTNPADIMLWRGMAYDAQGKPLMEYHGNGIGTKNRYHPTRGFVESSQTYRWTNNKPIQDLDLHIDDLGNVKWRKLTRYESDTFNVQLSTPQIKTETFNFDSQNRLTSSAVVGQSAQNTSFKANGNIDSKEGRSFTYGNNAGPHAVTGVTGSGGNRRYTYDAKGRMEKEYLQGAGPGGAELLLRQISYTSFDQPNFIQHWRSAPLSSDLDDLRNTTTNIDWDQQCTIRFYFGAGMQRLIQEKIKGALVTRSLSLGGFEIRETRRGMGVNDRLVEKEVRSNFGNGSRVIRTTATNPVTPIIVYEFSAEDHLGSDSVTYDSKPAASDPSTLEQGKLQQQRGHLKSGETQKSERQSYDAWGARRDGETWAPSKGALGAADPNTEREGSNVTRGYTGHEMLDDVGLVHMNGRLYDSALGRMCSADPYVQAPENIQNYNRYTYVLNNPVSATDPTGYFFGFIFAIVAAVAGVVGAVISTVFAFVAYLATLAAQFVLTVVGLNGAAAAMGTIGSSLLASASAGLATVTSALGAVGAWAATNPILAGALFGGVYSGAQTAIKGGSFSDVLKAAAIGAVTGAIGGVVGGGLHALGLAADNAVGMVIHSLAHGIAGGAMSEALGGSFKDGFIGSLIGSGVSTVSGIVFGPAWENLGILGRTAVSALSGGAASVLTGGKFANGAYSAAFFHLFNDEAFKQWDGYRDQEQPYATVGEDPIHWSDSPEAEINAMALAARMKGQKYIAVGFYEKPFYGTNAFGSFGEMALYDEAGQILGTWKIVSGGQATSAALSKGFRNKNTRIPSGEWSSGRFISHGFDQTAPPYTNKITAPFTRHDFTFKFAIPTPGTPRSGILFHPSPGITEGCIGLHGSASGMEQFFNLMHSATSNGKRVPVIVN